MFPTLPFRQAYDALFAWHGDRADVEYVRLLHAAATGGEGAVVQTLTSMLAHRRPLTTTWRGISLPPRRRAARCCTCPSLTSR